MYVPSGNVRHSWELRDVGYQSFSTSCSWCRSCHIGVLQLCTVRKCFSLYFLAGYRDCRANILDALSFWIQNEEMRKICWLCYKETAGSPDISLWIRLTYMHFGWKCWWFDCTADFIHYVFILTCTAFLVHYHYFCPITVSYWGMKPRFTRNQVTHHFQTQKLYLSSCRTQNYSQKCSEVHNYGFCFGTWVLLKIKTPV